MYFYSEKYGCVEIDIEQKGNWWYAYFMGVQGCIAAQLFSHEPTRLEIEKAAKYL